MQFHLLTNDVKVMVFLEAHNNKGTFNLTKKQTSINQVSTATD
uniref:Uncharacterized protein n=1 Tax=Rhizophora mucronata TaxID=61149 RepID=A0A2P2NIX7_RHIMU